MKTSNYSQRIAKFYLWVHVEKECWQWKGRCTRAGYSVFWNGSKTIYGHRFSYELFNEEKIPKHLVIDHICRNRKCVNPFHLRLVTPRENCLSGISPAALNAKKSRCPLGHPLKGWNAIRKGNKRECRTCSNHNNKMRRRIIRRRQRKQQYRKS